MIKKILKLSKGLYGFRKVNIIYLASIISQVDRIKYSKMKIKYPFLVISGKSKYKTIWDIFLGVCVLLTAFVSPLDIAFKFSDSV